MVKQCNVMTGAYAHRLKEIIMIRSILMPVHIKLKDILRLQLGAVVSKFRCMQLRGCTKSTWEQEKGFCAIDKYLKIFFHL